MSKEISREPLFHIAKRGPMPVYKRILIYASAILGALIVTSIFCSVTSKKIDNPLEMFSSMFSGAFGTERRIWQFLRDGAILLGVSLALLPAFRMKFWNLGANGQIVIAGLVTYAFMLWGSKNEVPHALVYVLMAVCGVLASIAWAAIPAIFKAFFKTNETLFTLMMNYIAQGLVTVMISIWAPQGSGNLSPIDDYGFPSLINEYMLPIIVIAAITAFIVIYLAKGKQGYEIAVVGDSENTAKYAGMNVKLITIRTLVLSGAICGIVGVLLTGGIQHIVSDNMHSNMGFTAIMTSWLADFNPLVVIITSFLIIFITKGMGQVKKDFKFANDSIANVALGIIYFCIIACQFFINYKLVFRKKKTAGLTAPAAAEVKGGNK